jgi:hypothetical protein
MKEQLSDAWQINNRMNLLLMDNISDAGMQKTLSNRGRTVYLQLAHMHNVRLNWLEVCARDIFKKYPAIKKKQHSTGKHYIKLLKILPMALKS